MRGAKRGKTADIDGVLAEMLKEAGWEVVKFLKTLFNKCFENGEIPEDCSNAYTILIY